MAWKHERDNARHPRKTLESGSAHTLSDCELLSLLLISGDPVRKTNSSQLAEDILKRTGSLCQIGRAHMKALALIPGVGAAKAARLIAGIELGRRVLVGDRNQNATSFHNSLSAYHAYAPRLQSTGRKVLLAVLLDSEFHWISDLKISEGMYYPSDISMRNTFNMLLKESPSGILLLSYHPSKDTQPTTDEHMLTTRFHDAGVLLGIRLIDHLVIRQSGYYSFADNKNLEFEQIEDLVQSETDSESYFPANMEEDPVAPDLWCLHDLDLENDGD